MNIRKIYIVVTLVLVLLSCGKKDKVLEGPLKIDSSKQGIILYNDGKVANGIIKGSDLILGLDYDLFYKDGKPTGKVIYYIDNKKAMELNLNIDYSTQTVKGDISIYEYSGKSAPLAMLEYKNITSNLKNFFDLEDAKPSLKWYLENPVNVFDGVEIYKGTKKVSSIAHGKYYFYDEDGQALEMPAQKSEDSEDVYLETLQQNLEENENLKLSALNDDIKISYEKNDKSYSKIKIGTSYANGSIRITDDNDNSYTLDYKDGKPTGNFVVDAIDNGSFKIIGNGKYDANKDEWNGQIDVKFEDGREVVLKKVKIKGKNLFLDKNIINYQWISFEPTIDDPLDSENIFILDKADVYFEGKLVKKVLNGNYVK